jgi:glucosamine-6-phosphate deaminase
LEEGLSFENVVTFNLDEYFPLEATALQSYVKFMHDQLFDHIDIKPENINIPDGTLSKEDIVTYCHDYEENIEKFGGLDIQILGIGRTGHIGFNEPGSSIQSATRMVNLDHITRIDAASDFFGEENVPMKAITMGVGTILKARRIIIMAWGEGKAKIVSEAIEMEPSDSVPATYLQYHANTTFVIDKAAAAELTREKRPWQLGTISWTEELMKRAVILLSEKLNKPILKLTARDYNDHGMSDLILEFDTAYNINIKIFNDLQHTITGWPGGKPNVDDTNRPERAAPAKKKVLIFSPHPDDDVISMGGTFLRLVDQGHEVHVAYQTSGNIAVFDDDVIRFADFFVDLEKEQNGGKSGKDSLYHQVIEAIKNKKPGDIDAPVVQKIKGLIRRGEAKAGCRYVGIPDENMHFMDMPFYETGTIEKNPIGPEDVEITAALIKSIKPHQIYAAGDLSDPHGTHRVCLDAIFQAVDVLKPESFMDDCWVWLYRGAWQEWSIEDIEMAVPLSPSEVLRKKKAIFKHQSQKDTAVFPGSDVREFWQRASDRNEGTADIYNKLGLPEYEAMEAFKRYHF